MKQALAWTLTSLLVLGTAGFYYFSSAAQPPLGADARKVMPTAASTGKPKPTLTPEQRAKQAELRAKIAQAKIKMGESMKKLDDSLARTAQSSTPEMRARMVDAKMRSATPRYNALFNSWQLDAATREQVLEIIRDRELQHQENFQKLGQTGSSGVRQYLNSKKSDKELAETQLVGIIGADHVTELSALEDQMEQEATARGKEIYEKMQQEKLQG